MAGRGDKKSNCLGTLEWTKLSMRFDHLSACRQFYFELYYSQIACLPACTFGMATNVAGSGGKGQNCLWLFICMHGQTACELWPFICLQAVLFCLPACTLRVYRQRWKKSKLPVTISACRQLNGKSQNYLWLYLPAGSLMLNYGF